MIITEIRQTRRATNGQVILPLADLLYDKSLWLHRWTPDISRLLMTLQRILVPSGRYGGTTLEKVLGGVLVVYRKT